MKPDDVAPAGTEQPLLAHLLELRQRLLMIVAGVLVVFVPMAIFANNVYSLVAAPLLAKLPAGGSMIATEVASPFLAPIKLSFILSFAVAMPWVLYQVWAFVAPGLYKSEKRLVVPLMVSSTLLFYVGVAFAYFLVLPAVFRFTIGFAPEGVAVMTDITKYLDFVLTLFLAFGVAFETPVALVLLVKTGFVTPATLAKHRDYVFVGAFVIGAIFTPPDVVSQIMLAVPIYLLYELGIIAARVMVPGARQVELQRQEP
jgi:sec-independent protein translocase protein TatC